MVSVKQNFERMEGVYDNASNKRPLLLNVPSNKRLLFCDFFTKRLLLLDAPSNKQPASRKAFIQNKILKVAFLLKRNKILIEFSYFIK